MTISKFPTLTPQRQPLEWESNHFGIRAEVLRDANFDDNRLADVLREARTDDVELLVWPAIGGRDVSPELLDEYSGLLVDRKATFGKLLEIDSAAGEPAHNDEHAIAAYDAATASPALVELAIAAGIYSRFGVDPRIERERFEAMYRIWIERSVRGELADVVLIAPLDGAQEVTGRLGGMITLSQLQGTASIGLVAVATEMRGRGVGTALMRAAQRWMLAHEAREARVVTQFTNAPACRLYERAGYRLNLLQHYYHFWLQSV